MHLAKGANCKTVKVAELRYIWNDPVHAGSSSS